MYLNSASEIDHLSHSSPGIQSLYYKYKDSIVKFGPDVGSYCTEKIASVFKAKRRIAVFHFHPDHLRIWFNLRAGQLNDPQKIILETEKGYSLCINSNKDFDYIIGLIKQSYNKNR